MTPKPHWHEHNPWRDRCVYVPIAELAACLWYLGQLRRRSDGTQDVLTVDVLVHEWAGAGPVDAYVLRQPSGWHSGGIRFGAAPDAYLSPYFDNRKLEALLQKYEKPQ